MTSLRIVGTAHQVRVVASRADLQYLALHRNRLGMPGALVEGVLQLWPLAKYAVAFPRMPGSICSALTGLLLKLL